MSSFGRSLVVPDAPDTRITRHQMWMDMAHVAAKRSTCYRGNVGAILVRDRRVLSVGYNGPGPGEQHCTGASCERTPEGGCRRSLHAEMNAILRSSSPPEEADLYVTVSPCSVCAAAINGHGIRRVYYSTPYRDESPLHVLQLNGVVVRRVAPNGMLICPYSNDLVDE